ncbi:hypothetical protein ZIOFF_009822 [Zingiber officinale]|uniref:Uncharacterized protein n=1 Tax=Zingiber officinale TaxID=94328 RepID=A0A8J5HHW2_ZINOF|nr:hypothetical protein ZIOFF_009822 [Zingiber officinale]
MTNMGSWHTYYLGIKVNQRGDGIFIPQEGYAKAILKKFKMDNSKPINTPIECGIKLSKHDEGESVDPTFFKSFVGSLLYLTCTRPDILYGVELVRHYMEAPTTNHFKVAKRILHYIKSIIDFGLSTPHAQPLCVAAADYGTQQSRRDFPAATQSQGNSTRQYFWTDRLIQRHKPKKSKAQKAITGNRREASPTRHNKKRRGEKYLTGVGDCHCGGVGKVAGTGSGIGALVIAVEGVGGMGRQGVREVTQPAGLHRRAVRHPGPARVIQCRLQCLRPRPAPSYAPCSCCACNPTPTRAAADHQYPGHGHRGRHHHRPPPHLRIASWKQPAMRAVCSLFLGHGKSSNALLFCFVPLPFFYYAHTRRFERRQTTSRDVKMNQTVDIVVAAVFCEFLNA